MGGYSAPTAKNQPYDYRYNKKAKEIADEAQDRMQQYKLERDR